MTTRGKKNERGASAVEYGLLTALVAVAIVFSVKFLGTSVGLLFAGYCASLNGGSPCTVVG